MLIDTQLLSMVHRPLHEARIPRLKEIFLITWSRKAYPLIGVLNLRCRQISADIRNTNKMAQKHTLDSIKSWLLY